jgi:hypothetical protein
VIHRDEGGDREGYKAAVNIVKSCISLTYQNKWLNNEHPWFRFNHMSKRLEWLHLNTVYSDLYTECFESAETRITNTPKAVANDLSPEKGTASGSGQQPIAGGMQVAGPAAVKSGKRPRDDNDKGQEEDESAKGQGKRRTSTGGKSGESKEGPTPHAKAKKLEEQRKWTKLTAAREKMRAASSTARDLKDMILQDQSWAWARNEVMLAGLDKAHVRLKLESSYTLDTKMPTRILDASVYVLFVLGGCCSCWWLW